MPITQLPETTASYGGYNKVEAPVQQASGYGQAVEMPAPVQQAPADNYNQAVQSAPVLAKSGYKKSKFRY